MQIQFPSLVRLTDVFEIRHTADRGWSGNYIVESDPYIRRITVPDRSPSALSVGFKTTVRQSDYVGEGLYMVVSDRYPAYYIGQSGAGLKARMFTHIAKMLALNVGHNVNHTAGWRSFASDRAPRELPRDDLQDVWVSFAHVASAKSYEKSAWVQLCARVSSLTKVEILMHHRLTSSASGKLECECVWPENLPDIVRQWA